ncbi:hypothetical protein M422DRAFT_242548 [Sphaerobolus stellatus SS14]|nr:hypothetical protein M422DRAFT_242548 [Sphaerobolus stellatus SS14]
MATLDTPAQPPPRLQHEQPPSVNDLIAQIDNWVIYHLTSIFLSRRRYMLTPQAILRRAMSDNEVAEDLANVSIGSTGAFHESRHLAGVEQFKQFPDFVIVKVKPQPGIERDHYIADEQMERYMEQAANLPLRVEHPRGYLVMGNRVRIFWLQDDGEGVVVFKANETFKMSDAGDQFTRELCDISIRNWNYQS